MNFVARLKLGSGLVAAVLALIAPASAVMQSESGSEQTPIVTIATAADTSVLPSAPSSTLRTETAAAGPAAFPAAPALIAPVRNERKIGERPTFPKKKYISLMALQHSAVAFDTWSTRRLVESGGRELNPLLKPVAHSDALYPVMQAWPFAVDYLAARMARSDKPWMRKMWWVPQTASAASSFIIGARNVSLANSSQKLVK